MAPDWPLEMLNTALFTETNGKTTITLTAVAINATESEIRIFTENFGNVEKGWGGTMEQLENYLAEIQSNNS